MEPARHTEWLFRQLGSNNADYERDNPLQQWARDQFEHFLDPSNEARLREIAVKVCTSQKAAPDKPLPERVESVYKAIVAELPDDAVTEDAIDQYTVTSIAEQKFTLEEFNENTLRLLKDDNLSNARKYLRNSELVLDREPEALIRKIITEILR